MKKLYVLLLLSMMHISFAQDSRLFDNYWYLTDVIENGVSNVPPTWDMGISFDQQSFQAHGCLSMWATVTFENNATNFSATNFQYCLCMCFNPEADAYENNKYFPFLNYNYFGDPATVNYFTYSITESSGVKSLIITSAFNKQAVYSSEHLANQHFNKADFGLYPNPSSDFVDIRLTNETDSARVAFFNEIGLLCKTEEISPGNTRIETKGLPAGIYLVKVTTNNGTVTKKLIKI